jgi:hypothetical protein
MAKNLSDGSEFASRSELRLAAQATDAVSV